MREREIQKLKTEKFDLLVIGGGATGSGVAVDASSRGLRAALIERRDFSSETSSRSTKLVHGGVRYLQTAIMQLDPGQLELVREALHERGNFLRNAPHLAHDLPIMTPIYSWFEAFYYFIGLRVYDFLARNNRMPSTKFRFKSGLLRDYPMLNGEGLKGGLLYHDGQFDDARMNVALTLTARELGATTLNYVEFISPVKLGGKTVGAQLRDVLTGETWETRARVVVNATGAFSDSIRFKDNPAAHPMLKASTGSHLILDHSFIPPDRGILIPKTQDGRVVFILPWNGKTLVGTTDNAAPISENPKPTDEDIHFILETVRPFYKNPPTQKDILSSWTGLRPLVSEPTHSGTASLSRDHVIDVSNSGILSIMGGKWTTYRKMAEDVVDRAIELADLHAACDSRTENMKVIGAYGFSEELAHDLQTEFQVPQTIASHLVRSYGDRATEILRISKNGYPGLLHPKHPYLEAEVIYGVQYESAQTIVDILARRTRLSFLDLNGALESIPRVADLMSPLLDWTDEFKENQIRAAREYLAI